MGNRLPEEVLLEILSRLTFKILMRFKCVSKAWLYFITDDSTFAQLQFDRSSDDNNENAALVFQILDSSSFSILGRYPFFSIEYNQLFDKTQSPPPPPPPQRELDLPCNIHILGNHYILIGSCNGLLCLRPTELINRNDFNSPFYLWNPSTKEFLVTIPGPPPFPPNYFTAEDIPCAVYGFGFHPVTKEYKLVTIWTSLKKKTPTHSKHSLVSVYTLGEDCWRMLPDIPYNVYSRQSCSLVDGALHWKAASTSDLNCSQPLILSFDIRDEVFGDVPPPPPLGQFPCSRMKISNLGGLLSVCYTSPNQREFQVWVMKEYRMVNSWVKQYASETQIELHDLAPLYVLKDGNVLFLNRSHQLIAYNPRCDSVQEYKPFNFRISDTFLYPYMRSLISPLKLKLAMRNKNEEQHGRKWKR